MNETIINISRVLSQASETHHVVFALVDGNDPDWASWYSEWLLTLSELPKYLENKPVKSELIYMLVKLNKDYLKEKPEKKWEDYYAEKLEEHFR